VRATLATLVADFRRHGDQTAVVRFVGNRRLRTSYAELARYAGRFAAELKKRHIVAGDRVLLWGENSAEWLGAFFGCILRGVLVVPLDASGAADFALRVAADVRPSLVVGDPALLANFPQDLDHLSLADFATALPEEEAPEEPSLSADTPLQILFTSGTTGEPKGVVHTHRNILASLGPIEREMQKYLRYERIFHPLRFLHTLPFSHVFGQFMGIWIPPILAAEVHLESRLVGSRLMEIIRRERISVLAAVPRVIALMKAHLESEDENLPRKIAAAQGFSAWKRWWYFRRIHKAFGLKFWAIVCGGASLPAELEQFWSALGFVLVQGYGMTETAALITLNHPFRVARGSIGKPLPGREVKLGPDGEVLVRGEMISQATWQQGSLKQREDPWLATGDLAEALPSGELRFLGRKSEVIVTSSGMNIHPEDLEAALQRQPGILANAVVGVETPNGREPFAVLVFRGERAEAAAAVQNANEKLPEFQRIRRWALWPDPDLPRTSTGKVQRRRISAWLQETGLGRTNDLETVSDQDWLTGLIRSITSEEPARSDDEARLEEDLHLDSLGRVQLAAMLEDEFGAAGSEEIQQIATLGELRKLVGLGKPAQISNGASSRVSHEEISRPAPTRITRDFIYPHWPWALPFQVLRTIFIETIMRTFVFCLAGPKIERQEELRSQQPMLLIANHVTAYDAALLFYALPRSMRDQVAVAMAGEILDDWRHARNQETWWQNLLGPITYGLVTALFNVFPLPRTVGFQRSFAHAGEALDRGYHVLVFPEGGRSPDGKLRNFRGGIGILAQQARTPILPMALIGLGELKLAGKGWFRSGKIEIRVGTPIRPSPSLSAEELTELLFNEVKNLMQ
jgi:long-chain acyl-CoA synthetase